MRPKVQVTPTSLSKKEYDFSKSIKNPYTKQLKQQVTLRLGVDVLSYFKQLGADTGVPYQNMINLYLQQCAESKMKLKFDRVSRA